MAADPELAPPDAKEVARAFGLGEPAGPMTFAARGEQGAIWCLVTDRGRWAVKAPFETEPGEPDDVAFQRAAAAAGLPLPRPVVGPEDRVLVHCGPGPVRVYEWVDLQPGVPCPAARAGQLLAAIHALRFPAGEVHPWYHEPLGPGRWEALLASCPSLPDGSGERLAGLIPELRGIEEELAGAVPGSGLVRGHLDFNPENVVITATGSPVILDWENSGATDPAQEVAMAAFDFAAMAAVPDLVGAVELVAGYRVAGGHFEPSGLDMFAMALAVQAHLLEWYAGRSLSGIDEPTTDSARASRWLAEMTTFPLTRARAEELLDRWRGAVTPDP